MLQWSRLVNRVFENLQEIKVNSDWSQFEKIIANLDTYEPEMQSQLFKYREAEHQLNRYANFKSIANDLRESSDPGDVIEFGSWQGLGITMLAKALGTDVPRKFIGIDSFEGLPDSSGGWQKGQFSDTTVELCKSNVLRHLSSVHQLELIKCWFDDPNLQKQIQLFSQNVSVVHFDCDLGSSLLAALPIIEPYLVVNKQMFLIFDDWGCHADEIPDAFHLWYNKFNRTTGIKLSKYSSTKLTRTYVHERR